VSAPPQVLPEQEPVAWEQFSEPLEQRQRPEQGLRERQGPPVWLRLEPAGREQSALQRLE
jgi:hypothetical protein